MAFHAGGGMRSILEEEIRDRLNSLAFRIRQYDVGVVLSAALCFTPLPPAILVGLILAGFHLAFTRTKLSSYELSLLVIAMCVAAGYIALWAIAIYWLSRTGQLHAWLDLLRDWWSWIVYMFEPSFLRRPIAPPNLQHA